MNLAALFIRRPVMTTLVMSAILIFGILSYRRLPVSDLPNVDFPTLLVTANLPGASPETMASSVATPLERQFSTIAGLDSMSSTNSIGLTSITLQFTLDRQLDAAAQDVQSAIAQAQAQLPREMPSPPSYKKVNPADQPVLYLALVSKTMPLSDVDEYAETIMAQRISMVSGVAQVQVIGSQKYAVRVRLDPQAMAQRELGVDEVVKAIQGANINLPTGTLHGSKQALTIESDGQLLRAQKYPSIVVAYRNGAPVRLEDVGTAVDSVEDDKIASWYTDTRGIILAVQRQPGTNTVEVVDNIKNLLPSFRRQIPEAVELNILFDRSQTIRESVDDVRFTLLLTIVLVVAVIFVFLRNVSATLIPSLALPMSLIGTFVVMLLLGFSLNNLSLMALTLSVGFVVDDAIVMLENIVRHLEQGKPAFQAALDGSKEIAFTIVSMTISLAAVFIPVLFMGGILGRLLYEFGVTIAVSIVISGVVSLTLTPMLCSRFLRAHGGTEHGRLYKLSERGFDFALRVYETTLGWTMRVKPLMFAASLILLGVTGWLFASTPKGFLPYEDTGSLFAFTEAAQGISFEAMAEHQNALSAIVQADPNVESFMSSIGASGPNSALNSGRIFIRLKPKPGRKLGVDEVIDELRPKLAKVTGIRAYLQNLPPIRLGGQLTKSPYQLTLQAPDTAVLYSASQALESKLRQLPQLTDVNSDLQITNPQVRVRVDRDRAALLGIQPAQIEETLYSAYGARQISTIYAPNNAYRVIVEFDPTYQRNATDLSRLHVRSSEGELIPLEALATLEPSVGPLTVNHLGQLPAVTLSFGLAPGVALSDAVASVYAAARDTLPADVTTSFQGIAQAFESSLQGLGLLLLMAILVIYIVLGVLYESFIHPITILSGLPSAGAGALLTLQWFKLDLNVYAFVGVIMLVGIVKKNAIMMIDFALSAQREQGKTPEAAIVEGCSVRFRPIMMTTMAALMGTLPIAMGIGAGAESRRALGLAVVGGLVVSQLLTLYLTPVYYVYLDRLGAWLTPKRRHETVIAM